MFISQENLTLFKADLVGFLKCLLSQIVYWVITSSHKQSDNHIFSSTPRKVVSSVVKVIPQPFFGGDAKGVAFIDYFQKGHPMNEEYTINLL